MRRITFLLFATALLLATTSCNPKSDSSNTTPATDSTAKVMTAEDSANHQDQMNAAADTMSMQTKDTTNSL